ncbi:hypothetical protein [Marinospirillum minutulum]|uniref:hypothetical protein n=1 Tax=Marinospirillum minutulum TaxID=64974 RepID=UPI001B7F94AF|nr:hypothetical protein [Marinospirillum minutulum]
MSTFFDELLESVQQMDEIVKGERVAARDFHVDAFAVKNIRKATGLTQDAFRCRLKNYRYRNTFQNLGCLTRPCFVSHKTPPKRRKELLALGGI